MNIILSSGTGSGKSSLLDKCQTSGYYIMSQTTTSLYESNPHISSNLELYKASVNALIDLESTRTKFMMDRHPIDYLVGCVLLNEVSLIEAYKHLDELLTAIKRPQLVIITPLQPPGICYNVVTQREARRKYWERIFASPIDDDACNVYLGMTISRDLAIDFVRYLQKYTDKVAYATPEPSVPSSYFTWTIEAQKLINLHTSKD